MPAAEAIEVVPPLVDLSGQPIESEQKKAEARDEGIRQLFARYAMEQNARVATMVLARATREAVNRRTNIGQLCCGGRRMSFSLAFQIRARFLLKSRTPPASVYDIHHPIGERRRREIIRQFTERPDHIAHLAASAIINDAEFAGSIVDSWGKTFEEAHHAAKHPKNRENDRPARARAEAAPEAARAADVSLRDDPRES